MGLLYGRAGRLTAENGGFRPGQYERIGMDGKECPVVQLLSPALTQSKL
jgi:hypothetical protein